MTLILTHISKDGIIHASDSNLTSADGTQAGQARKTFPIDFLRSGLTLAGAYSVGGVPMDTWMTAFIQDQERIKATSLEEFARLLKQHLETNMLPKEKAAGCMMHLAGYVEKEGAFHPEFWFIRNVHSIDSISGEYKDIDDRFDITEDFWTRDCPKGNLMVAFEKGVYQFYINGFASGRMGFFALQQKLDNFLQLIWAHPPWKFRPPKSLEETALLVKMYMEIINTLFMLSDYSAPMIGGDIQTHIIHRPANTITSF